MPMTFISSMGCILHYLKQCYKNILHLKKKDNENSYKTMGYLRNVCQRFTEKKIY